MFSEDQFCRIAGCSSFILSKALAIRPWSPVAKGVK
jgi:hypothetical protein